ncbi:DUF3313 family protein [Methylobacterium sp. M6A4_1b]
MPNLPNSAADGSEDLDRRRFAALLLAATVGGVVPNLPTDVSAQADPPTGRVFEFAWTDTLRARAVPARLYWPATAQGRVPLIVFSHGLGGSRNGYRYLGEYWSAHGYASLHVQHTGSDDSLWRGDPFQLVARLTDAARIQEAVQRAHDVSFALNRILDPSKSRFGATIDTSRIIAAGHSYGANTVLILAGARVHRDGKTIRAPDARIRAGIAISAPAFYGETDLKSVLGGISIPTLHVTSTGDDINIPDYRSGADDRYAVYEAVGTRDKLMTVFEGGSHGMFTDRPLTGGVVLNPQVKSATAELTLAFFDLVYRADRLPLSAWTEKWGAILASPPRIAPTAFAPPPAARRRSPRSALRGGRDGSDGTNGRARPVVAQSTASGRGIPLKLKRILGIVGPLLLSVGCVTAPPRGASSLSSEGLVRSDGVLTQSMIDVKKETVLAAQTVRIVPTRFAADIGDIGMGPGQRALIANATDRALCRALGERLEIVTDHTADLTVSATVTHATPTNPAASGLSRVASVGVPLMLPGIPMYVPRLPIGLGSLSVEAEAKDKRGRRAAAMIWGRSADVITSEPRVSTDGDAYDLAGVFGEDFANLLVTGESPFAEWPRLPRSKEVSRALGLGPDAVACDAYGASPGLVGHIGRRIGLPPDWTDRGAPAPDKAL